MATRAISRTTLLFALLLAISSFSIAQEQTDIANEYQRKWLNCDIDWIYSSVTTRSEMTVRVVFRGIPVPGASVILRESEAASDTDPDKIRMVTHKTDSTGRATSLQSRKASTLLPSMDSWHPPSS